MPTSLHDVTIPDTLADFPFEAVSDTVSKLDLDSLDGQWHCPVDDLGMRIFGSKFDFSVDHAAFEAWRKLPGNTEVFRTALIDGLSSSAQRIENLMRGTGMIRLIARTFSADADVVTPLIVDGLAEHAEYGLRDPRFGLWSWDTKTGPSKEVNGDWGDGGTQECLIVADWQETSVDWGATMLMFTGFGDFEHEVVLKPGARPAEVVSVTEINEGNTPCMRR